MVRACRRKAGRRDRSTRPSSSVPRASCDHCDDDRARTPPALRDRSECTAADATRRSTVLTRRSHRPSHDPHDPHDPRRTIRARIPRASRRRASFRRGQRCDVTTWRRRRYRWRCPCLRRRCGQYRCQRRRRYRWRCPWRRHGDAAWWCRLLRHRATPHSGQS